MRVDDEEKQGTHFDLSEDLDAEQVNEQDHEDDDRDPDRRVVLLVVPVLNGSDGSDDVVGGDNEVLQEARMDCQAFTLRARK